MVCFWHGLVPFEVELVEQAVLGGGASLGDVCVRWGSWLLGLVTCGYLLTYAARWHSDVGRFGVVVLVCLYGTLLVHLSLDLASLGLGLTGEFEGAEVFYAQPKTATVYDRAYLSMSQFD